ncbi:MAG: hypothetical protein Q9159_002019 [Coniocarpon cinnabarinum]
MPPSVPLQQNAPWQANLASPPANGPAVDVVELPDGEAAQKDEAAEKNRRGQQRVHPLMERRVLQVMVISGDEDGKATERQCYGQCVHPTTLVREGGIAGDAGGVDHGELVNKLHGIFERGVEEEGAAADGGIASEGDEKDSVVVVAEAGASTEKGEDDEEKISEGVRDFGGDGGEPVVLYDTEIEQKAAVSQQQIAIVKAQIAGKNRESRLLQLTMSEMSSIPKETPVYEGIGKLSTNTTEVKENIDKQSGELKTDISNLEKRLHYLETTAKNSQAHIDQMLKSGGKS